MSVAAMAGAAEAVLVLLLALVVSIFVAMFFERFDFHLLKRDEIMDREIALVQSKTFWAALLALFAVVAKNFGWSQALSFAADPNSIDTILNIVSVVGIAGAMVFRTIAGGKVTSVLPKGSANAASAIALLALVVVGFALLPGRAFAYARFGAWDPDLDHAFARAVLASLFVMAIVTLGLVAVFWRREIDPRRLRSFAFLGLLAAAAPVMPSSCAQNAANNINTGAANVTIVNGATLNLEGAAIQAGQQQAAVLGPIICGGVSLATQMSQNANVQANLNAFLQKNKAAGYTAVALTDLCAIAAGS